MDAIDLAGGRLCSSRKRLCDQVHLDPGMNHVDSRRDQTMYYDVGGDE